MTTHELCESAGLSHYQVQTWLDTGLLEAETIGIPGGGRRFEFDAGQAYVVYDGCELRACRDAAAAIAAVVRARRPCSAVDLSAIRTAGA